MKKYCLVLLLLGLLLSTARAVSAAEVIDSGSCGDSVTYTLYDTGELVISGTGEMPNYQSYSNVPWYSKNESIQTATIESGVTSISNYAFWDCSSLTSITIPDSVISFGKYAFCNCSGLTSVTIPNGVTSIGSSAFQGCSGLKNITIPKSVTDISSNVFTGCRILTSILVDEDNARYCNDEKGVLYDKAKTELLYAPKMLSGDYIIPNSVNSIGGYAFHGCSNLKSVTMGNGVTSFGICAFQGCSSLRNITIPDSVNSIGGYAFHGCRNLTSITIPDGVTSISNCAFQGCSSLTSITIPDGVTSIGGAAFYGCSGLTSIIIPDSVSSIGNTAFCDCSRLTSITIPDGVTSIGGSAFFNCSSLTSIAIPDGVTSIDEFAFCGCSSLTSITIPDGVISIGVYAFSDCSGLTSITIPVSVMSIGDNVFARSGVSNVYYSGDEESWKKITVSSNGNSALTGATIHYDFGCPKITDDTLTELLGATTVTIRDKTCNVATQLHDVGSACNLIVVLSGDAGVTDVSTVGLTANQTQTSAALPVKNAKTVTVLVWDRVSDMKPLCRAKKLEIPVQ